MSRGKAEVSLGHLDFPSSGSKYTVFADFYIQSLGR